MSTIDDLLNANESYSENSVSDKIFTNEDLDITHHLYLGGVFPSSFLIIDNNNMVSNVPDIVEEIDEYNTCTGTHVYFDAAITGEWKIRFYRGIKGDSGTDGTNSNISSDDVLKYIILFG